MDFFSFQGGFMKQPVFRGVCTALITPFSGGKVNLALLDDLIDFQRENGVSAVCVCGTTGESATLSDHEQEAIIAEAVKHQSDGMTIIAGTGSNNTAHAVELSQAADLLGVNAVLAVTPYYNKATSSGIIAHYTAIADAVTCPVILYNVPSRTGVNIPVEAYKELAQHPRIAGVKEASGDLVYAMRIQEQTPEDFYIWSGNDDLIVPMQSIGAMGVISVLSNVYPGETAQLLSNCISGDFDAALQMQLRLSPMIRALFHEVNPVPAKAAVSLLGFPAGTPRLPLTEATGETKKLLKEYMKKHGNA